MPRTFVGPFDLFFFSNSAGFGRRYAFAEIGVNIMIKHDFSLSVLLPDEHHVRLGAYLDVKERAVSSGIPAKLNFVGGGCGASEVDRVG